MINDRIEGKWIDSFATVFELCKIARGDDVAILSETQSRPLNVHLAELALLRCGARPFHVVLTTPPQTAPVPVRSTGASNAIQNQRPVMNALKACPVVIDLTVEGLMHSPETAEILKSGARILNISNEHPDALERLMPNEMIKERCLKARAMCKAAKQMTVFSDAGSELVVNMEGAVNVAVWGYTDKPGTLTHWPGGIVVSFPKPNSVNGVLVMDAGDVNITFKRYLESPVKLTVKDDFVVDIAGHGTDAELMRRYIAAWNDKNAYATSHVGFGLVEAARYEALAMYDQRDTNGTEIRAYAGNFLYSTGANEFADRFTLGHFDLPVRGCTIALDDTTIIKDGALCEVIL